MCTTSPMFILTLILNLSNISLFAPLLWSSYLTHTHSSALHIDKTSTSNLSGEGPLILQLVLLRTLTPMLLLMLILTIVLLGATTRCTHHTTPVPRPPTLYLCRQASRRAFIPHHNKYQVLPSVQVPSTIYIVHIWTSTKYHVKCQVPYLCSLLWDGLECRS